MMRSDKGLTLLETVVAIAICAIILGVLASVATSSLRESRSGNFKIQATQVLDTLGRRIAGGFDQSLLARPDEPIELTTSDLIDIIDLAQAEVAGMTATIENFGPYTVGATSLHRYRIAVCYGADSARRCVTGVTLGRQGT